jgi:glycosyltransferase involved in cell wall biosynthesis
MGEINMSYENLRVLLISSLPPPAGGISTWTKQYIEWAAGNSLNVDIVNTAVVGKRAEKINSKTNMVDELKRTINIIEELKQKIKKFKPNVIHLNTPCGKLGIIRDYLCAKIAKKNDVKLFIHYRCNIEDQVGQGIIQKCFLKQLANMADRNLVLNRSSKKYLSLETKNDSIMIANLINETFISLEPKIIHDEIKTISFVGHIQRTKGLFEIIDAAKKLPEIKFKLAGPVSNEIKAVEIPLNINFMGSITKQEVKELLYESDIFLFPSYTEGFANAMLEAMASGLPIITTPVGANADMIESSGGIIVEVGDCIGLVNAINNLKDPNVRLEMSNWNIDKVKLEYTTEKVMRKLISQYNNI